MSKIVIAKIQTRPNPSEEGTGHRFDLSLSVLLSSLLLSPLSPVKLWLLIKLAL